MPKDIERRDRVAAVRGLEGNPDGDDVELYEGGLPTG